MTGIERLRRLARSQDMNNVWTAMLARELFDIADQIERETKPKSDAAEYVSVSAYDLLPQEERDAIAWVREHGGIAYVKEEWNARSNLKRSLETAQAKVKRQQRHIESIQSKLSERREHIENIANDVRNQCLAFGVDVSECDDEFDMLHDLNEALSKRLMPPGMEWLLDVWPKWSNGEYCKFGDWWTADKYGDYEPKQLTRLAFFTPEQLREWEQDEGDNFGYEWDFMRPSDTTYRPDKAEPPAPKVLDADGVEIRVGDTVCGTRDMEPMRVVDTDSRECGFKRIKCEKEGDGFWFCPDELTHKLPVLAADGRPLRKGEHVYHVETGAELVVNELPKPGEYQAVVVFAPPASHLTSFDPDLLTHERFDSWERMEGDVTMPAATYCERMGIEVEEGCSFVEPMARDLVRRAKKLAERDAS